MATMWRETPADRARERGTIALVAAATNCEGRQLPEGDELDGELYRGDERVGILEIKHRGYSRGEFPTVYLERRKQAALLARSTPKCPGIFVVVLNDGWIGLVDVADTIDLPAAPIERKDRSDPADLDVGVHVPFDGCFRWIRA